MVDRYGLPVDDRRNIDRKGINARIKVTFSLEYEGELIDISPEGVGLKFHPLKTTSLDVGNQLRIQMNMNGRIVSLQGEVRRLTEKFGQIVVGLKYNRDDIATIEMAQKSVERTASSEEDSGL